MNCHASIILALLALAALSGPPRRAKIVPPLIFSMPITISTPGSQTRTLRLGIAPSGMATVGEGETRGRLDTIYGEREIPPPIPGAFDARWIIGGRGTSTNILPIDSPPLSGAIWKGRFAASTQPITIRWSMADARRAPWHLLLSDSADIMLQVSMWNGRFRAGTGVMVTTPGDDTVEIRIVAGGKIDFRIEPVFDFDPGPQPPPFSLSQNYPNPFKTKTEISYALPGRAATTLAIFNRNGAVRRTLVNDTIPAGRHTVEWDGTDQEGTPLPSGEYICRLKVGSSTAGISMILLR